MFLSEYRDYRTVVPGISHQSFYLRLASAETVLVPFFTEKNEAFEIPKAIVDHAAHLASALLAVRLMVRRVVFATATRKSTL